MALSKKPNIVVILTDDQGPWALGCSGNPEIRTPNLDRLATQGIRFDNFFCVSPVCSPARASLFTGRIPSQHGVHDWIREGNAGRNAIDFLKGQWNYGQALAEAGYALGLSGKWHLGNSAEPHPAFDHWYAHEGGGSLYYEAPMYRNGEREVVRDYITDVITDDALGFIDEYAGGDRPFYASVHYTAPHSPWVDNHPKDIVDSYNDCPFASCPQEPMHPHALINSTPEGCYSEPREHLKGYFAAVTAMDANVGRILDRLEEHGVRENTLVFFTSDNGYNCGHHGVWGKGNGTFPLNMYDTSVKVPTIISHPAAIPQGVVCEDLLSHYDFLPTLLDYLGLENPEADRLPGRSFRALLDGEGSNAGHDSIIIYDEYGPVRMVRTRTHKYVHRYPYGPHELYDLQADPGEQDNRVDDPALADLRTELKGMLEDWFVRYVNPAIDGAREAVYGKGQLRLAGTKGQGHQAYADDIGAIGPTSTP